MLPPFPQTVEVMRKRYHRALERVYTVADIESVNRPGLCPDNIFDFTDGTRLIVGMGRILTDRPQLHVSASAGQDSEAGKPLHGTGDYLLAMVDFMERACRHFAEISGETRSLEFAFFSEQGAPNWYLPCGTAG